MHDVDYLRTLSHSELVDLVLKKDVASRDLRSQLREKIMSRMWAETEATKNFSTLQEALNMLDFPCKGKGRRLVIHAVRQILIARIKEVDPTWDIPF